MLLYNWKKGDELETKISNKNLSRETLRIYWRHAKKYPRLLWICAFGSIITMISDLASPLAYKDLLDQLSTVAKGNSLNHEYETIGVIALLAFGSWLGQRISFFGVNDFECRAMKDITNYCFEYLHRHSFKFFSENYAGGFLKKITRFSAGFEVIADQVTMQLVPISIRIVLIIGIIFWRNSWLGIIFMSWTVIFVTFNIWVSRVRRKYDMIQVEIDTKVTGRLADTIGNNLVIKLFDGLSREVEAFQKLTEDLRVARFNSWKIAENSRAVQALSLRILEIIVFVVAVRFWNLGILTIGDFILLRSYVNQLVDRVNEIGQSVRRVNEVMNNSNEMTEILVTSHEIKDREGASEMQVLKGEIEFRNVQFWYDGNPRCVINNLSFFTKPGEKIGIAGHSGGGKTTILKLLTRLFDVSHGGIFIDGTDIRSVTLSSLNRSIAFVPQDPILFHRSLMENIRYSRPKASDQEVYEAARRAHCFDFISQFSQGFNTLVGERGVKLSGGERQRVAIARAFLMDAQILILDEATSALDSHSEQLIQLALSELMVGRTVIAIAHRLSTIARLDRILVIGEGQIVEEGSHEVLIQNAGTYNDLWELQTKTAHEFDVKNDSSEFRG